MFKCHGFFFVLLAFVTLVCPHSRTKSDSGASNSLCLAQMSLFYWTMPRNLLSHLTILGSVYARIACTFFGCGLIPSLDNVYVRYSVSMAQKQDLRTLTFKPAFCNLMKTLHNLARWSSKLPLEMHNRSSI